MKSILQISTTLDIIFILVFTNAPVQAESESAAVFMSIEFVANIETIGVAVRGTGLPATVELFYRQSGEAEWRTGHPLMRIKDGRLIPPSVLLKQLRAAGVETKQADDALSEQDKSRLLEYLRKMHGSAEQKNKITLTRKHTQEIKKTDASGKYRTVQVEVRKKRVFVKP